MNTILLSIISGLLFINILYELSKEDGLGWIDFVVGAILALIGVLIAGLIFFGIAYGLNFFVLPLLQSF